MNNATIGQAIRTARRNRQLTQSQLAQLLDVSAKTVSKWETGRGLPDVALLQPLADALGLALQTLLGAEAAPNRNLSCNLLRTRFYVCPLCGNILHGTGEATLSCCGIRLSPLEATAPDEEHRLKIENVEDEHYLTLEHPMTKAHFISFLAFLTSDRMTFVKLYPEGPAATRIQLRGHGFLYVYCNRHGLEKLRI